MNKEADRPFLARAVELARRNVHSGDGGPFGAVIVRHGEIIGEGWNRVVAAHDPTAHAEVEAIRAACRHLGRFHLDDCVLYASSEPCPMCLAAAYWARVQRIVFANAREDAAAIGFADEDLYAELGRPLAQRLIPTEHHACPDCEEPLRAWFANPDRTPY